MAQGYEVFKDFEDGKYVHLDDLKHLANCICGNLNNWTPSYRFWYNMYSYSSKEYVVCRWRQSKGLNAVAKWGEAICGDDLVNFLKIVSINVVVTVVYIISSFLLLLLL